MLSWGLLFPNKEMTKNKLLELTLKNFNPFSTCEVETLFETTEYMLKNLNETDPDFDERFDKIVLGTIVISLVIESNKYGANYYPQCNIKGYNVMSALTGLMNRAKTEKFILDIGEKILLNELPFSCSYIDMHFPSFTQTVPAIKERFAKYAPNDKYTSITNDETKSRWKICNII
jgi:hypothetical protein